MKGAVQGGEIVQVDGGQILRATGRKDRHSKVYTAKGPRDRRVRLSAHTAIQFYDVQDRLGYDRPSKAVDWLIKKAKASIDKLNETLPPPLPGWPNSGGGSHAPTPDSNPSSSDLALEQESQVISEYDFHPNNDNNSNNNNSSFVVGAAGEAHLMNTMKTLFPAASSFGGFDIDPCLDSSFQTRDLGLSLQTFQADSRANSTIPFQGNFHGWSGGGGGAIFAQGLSFSQRELLQSNAAVNPWNQRPLISADHHDQHHHQPRFELGFRDPARIYGEEEAAENHR